MATYVTIATSGQRIATTSFEFDWIPPVAGQRAKSYLVIDATGASATPSVTPSLQIKDPVSGKWLTIWTAAAAITGTGTKVYVLTDQSFSPTGMTETKQLYMTSEMQLTMTAADADPLTYSASMLEVNAI